MRGPAGALGWGWLSPLSVEMWRSLVVGPGGLHQLIWSPLKPGGCAGGSWVFGGGADKASVLGCAGASLGVLLGKGPFWRCWGTGCAGHQVAVSSWGLLFK